MKKFFSFLILGLSFAIQLKAQDFPYYFSVQSAPYAELTNNILLEDIGYPGDPWDDPYYIAPIGFSFDFLGTVTDSIYNYESVGAVFNFNNRLNSYYDPTDYLFTYGIDLIDRGFFTDTLSSPISYAIEGNAGSKIFKLQYKNAGFYNEVFSPASTASNFVNFQLWLYEGSNDIEIHFGRSDFPPIDSTIHIFEDFSGPLVAFIDSLGQDNFNGVWILRGDAADPEVIALTPAQADTLSTTLNAHPADGTVYRFSTSPNVGVEDLVHAESFKIFPTLVTDVAQMQVSNDQWIGERATLQLINGSGQVVRQYQGDLEANMELDLSQLPSGVYFFTLAMDDIHLSRKLVKQ